MHQMKGICARDLGRQEGKRLCGLQEPGGTGMEWPVSQATRKHKHRLLHILSTAICVTSVSPVLIFLKRVCGGGVEQAWTEI